MKELDDVRYVGRNENLDGFVDIIVIIAVVRTPHSVPMISGFVGLKREEARLIKNYAFNNVIVHYYRVRREYI